MSKLKLLNGVAHNLGHHATSGLCYIIPHLFRACQSIKDFEVILNLHGSSLFPDNLPLDRPLILSGEALLEKFREILLKAGLTWDDLTSATLKFCFDAHRPDTLQTRLYIARIGERSYEHDPAYHCIAEICGMSGKSYHHDFHSWHYNQA